MRRSCLSLLLAATLASPAMAQDQWQASLGIRGGFARVKPAGTGANDAADLFGLPSFSAGAAIPGNGAIFAIVPASPKMAIEPSLAFSQFTDATGGGSLNLVTLGLRADYALSPKFYAAAGATYTYTYSGTGASQLGIQVAAGYRLKVSSALNGRIEANWTTYGKTDLLPPVNIYGLELGLLAPVSGAPARSRGGAARLWSPSFGIQAGYSQIHIITVGDAALFTTPGFSGLLGVAGLAAPANVYFVLPIGQRWALEPSFDFLRAQANGNTQAGGHFAARLNYALDEHWYGAGGVNLIYIKVTGTDAVKSTGVSGAFGYRFPFMGAFTGRVEASYIAMGHNDDFAALAQGATNTFSTMFGLSVPLK